MVGTPVYINPAYVVTLGLTRPTPTMLEAYVRVFEWNGPIRLLIGLALVPSSGRARRRKHHSGISPLRTLEAAAFRQVLHGRLPSYRLRVQPHEVQKLR